MSKLTKKDLTYLRLIAEYRVLNSDQLTFLMAETRRTVQYRIKALHKNSLVTLTPENGTARRGKPQNIISLSPSGVEVLADTLESSQQEIFHQNMNKDIIHVEHELQTNWFRVNLLMIDRQIHDLKTEFISSTTPFIKCRENGLPAISEQIEVNGEQRSFVPDGVFSVCNSKQNFRLLFFLETDMSTEPISSGENSVSIIRKIENYHAYLISGYYKRYEKKWNDQIQGFRLLFLCDTTFRKDIIARNIGRYSTLDYVWITDRDSMFRDSLSGRIWVRGGKKDIPLHSILGTTHTLDLPPVAEV